MPSQAMIQAGREQTRQSLYGHYVRLSAEVEALKAERAPRATAARRRASAKPKE